MTTYHVFLSHNGADKPAVEELARRLSTEANLQPFLDKWHLVPGERWQEALEAALDASQTCAVFLGPSGLGTWENEEMRAALDIRAGRPDYRVIPVLLPGARLPERGRLPRFLARYTWVDFRPGLDDPDAFHRLVCGIKGIAPEQGPEVDKAVCPFRGLQVFDEEHARFFFGREALTQHLVEQLREDRFLAVIGPSGSGKSSLVRAGLVPQIRQGALPASNRWPILLFKPGADPLEALAAQLVPRSVGVDKWLAVHRSLLDTLWRSERGLQRVTQAVLASKPDNLRLIVVVDQFEELFTLCRDESNRASFIANLLYASAIAGGQTVVVITMRADFFGKCAAYPELAARLAERDVLVGPMSADELRQAMEGPAQAVGLHYEKGLVDTILGDLEDEPGALPLLQHTLLELWERRRGNRLTAGAYHEIGGVRGALAQRSDAIYEGLTPDQQEAARRVLLRLTQPGEGTEDTRRRARLAELLPAERDAADVEAVVRELVDARLLTTGEDERGNEIVDVSHEALIRGWPRLQDWIDEDRAGLRIHRQLTEAAQEWERHKRDKGSLYRGVRLVEAMEWAKAHAARLNPLEREFLRASQRAIWQSRILKAGAGVAATLIVVAIGLAVTGQLNRWIYRPLPMEWVGIPAGSFWMGSSEAEIQEANQMPVLKGNGGVSYNLSDETPRHVVILDAYEIGRYEVTNKEYRQCVLAGVCNPPSNRRYDKPDWDDDPVTDVNWSQANIFCEWSGGSLPTEAQWEKAARGPTSEPPRYPWGEGPDPERANVDSEAPMHVGSYSPGGDSYYGVSDMAGNVWEWVFDWYAEDYYAEFVKSPSDNPTGPLEETKRVIRGGSFNNDWIQARSTHRYYLRPGDSAEGVGLRCARQAQP